MAKALAAVGPLAAKRGFYLAGGTAVALRLGHRRSIDLDWFAPHLRDPLAWAAELRDAGVPFRVEATAPGTLHGRLHGVRTSFLAFSYPLLRKPGRVAPHPCLVAALDDLACMKLSAIAQRGSKKDFLDVFAIARRHAPLPRLLALYQRKFGVEDIGHLLYALCWFDAADRQRTPVMIWAVHWREVKRELERRVREIVLKQDRS